MDLMSQWIPTGQAAELVDFMVDLRFGETFTEDSPSARVGAQAVYGVANSKIWGDETDKRRKEHRTCQREQKQGRPPTTERDIGEPLNRCGADRRSRCIVTQS